jgi:hypothetical protein
MWKVSTALLRGERISCFCEELAACWPEMPSVTPATRGAIVGATWASVLLALLAAIKTTRYAHGGFAIADVLFNPESFNSSPGLIVGASVCAATVVGAAFGRIASRMTSPAKTRAALLVFLSFPALYLVLALALTIIWAPQAAKQGGVSILLLPVGSLLYAAFGMVLVVPVAAVPAILAAVMLEGWTRPDGQGRHGTADPGVLRLTMQALIVVMVVLAAVAAFRWPQG